MRPTPRQEQSKGILVGRSVVYITDGVIGLSKRVIPGPKPLFFVVTCILYGMIVIVRALENLPIFKTLSSFFRNIFTTAIAVDMPFPNIPR